jgi:hypothetical protein
MTMDERDVFVLADQALLRVVEQIGEGQWEMVIPDWFPRNAKKGDVTLGEIIAYHAYDDSWVPDMLAGKWRAIGVYGQAVPVPEGASLQDRLLGLTGREPDGASAAVPE